MHAGAIPVSGSDDAPSGASPAAAGPAGPVLEGQVAAFYLLALLSGAEPRGLAGAVIDRLKFQRGDEGHPMDDLIIDAHDAEGGAYGLDLQIKRSISFSPGDAVFEKVAGQIARSTMTAGPSATRTLGVATSQISRKIAGPYQDVLTWARAISSSAVFFARLNRKGAAGPDMARFVETVRTHLSAAGADSDDESLWRLLRRLRILVFDFTTEDSASLALAQQQCVLALHPDDASRASALWSALMDIALATDAVGGDIDRSGLVEALQARGFRLAADRRSMVARRALAEASSFTVEAIDDTVGGATLLRPGRLQAIHAALDAGRYVEIRGAGGVGKSGLLKHLARSLAGESALIALRPTRVFGQGWAAMRDRLGYDGSARDLLGELSASGGGLMLIDNAEGFTAEERATIVDLVRAAAATPGVSIVMTARLGFGVEEPSWLPVEALDALGRAPIVSIDELSDDEVAALRAAAPALADLLADHHPARSVVRNLFRLKRLARYEAGVDIQTELQLARRWWTLADGDAAGRRDRARLLRHLAADVLAQRDRHDVSTFPSPVVDALVKSESLTEVGPDSVVFRHDVLRDWAVFNALQDEAAPLAVLQLDRPTPASLARGFELYARHQVASAANGSPWRTLLDRLSSAGAHGSWRRTALLGILRADDASDLFVTVLPDLLTQDGALLGELIRTVMAVEVGPADSLYASLGVDLSTLPAGSTAPQGPSWFVLTQGVAAIADRLPAAMIASVVDLYTQWLIVTAAFMPSSARLVRQLYGWLVILQGATPPAALQSYFDPLPREDRSALVTAIRNAFVAFASAAPELAQAYIADLRAGRRSREAATSAVMFCGSLPLAAPTEYADLVAHLLIEPLEENRGRRTHREEPFSFLDHRFLPESPAQGPFLVMLRAAPDVALSLIRRLVDHEIAYDIQRGRPADDGFEIGMGADRRPVRAAWAYGYARRQARGHAVGSALLALEAWAHDRIEAGDDLGQVVDLLIGQPDVSAPFVLVAVDLILSHWDEPAAQKAIDLVASPELLVLDRERQSRELFSRIDMDWFGLGGLTKEPGKGRYTEEALRARPSRGISLERTLGVYFQHLPSRERLKAHFAEEATRLGPPADHVGFGDPAFMTAYVANLLNPTNWVSHDGPQGGMIYRSPPEEQAQLDRLRERSGTEEVELRLALTAAAGSDDPVDSALVKAAVELLGRPVQPKGESVLDDDRQIRAQAAMVIARDADDDTWREHGEGVRKALLAETERPDDHFGGGMSQLRYNPSGLAFLGLAHVFRRKPDRDSVDTVLRVAASGGMAAAQGFGRAASVLANPDSRLVVAVLRCAMTGSHSIRRRWDDDGGQEELQRTLAIERQEAADREMGWLFDGAAEPAWPTATVRRPHVRAGGIRLPGGVPPSAPQPEAPEKEPDLFFNHQAAASWLRAAGGIAGERWAEGFVSVYAPWMLTANGLGMPASADPDIRLDEWNTQFACVAVRALAEGAETVFTDLILDPLSRLPDRSIHDLAADLLKSLDYAYFGDHSIETATAVRVRDAIGTAVVRTRGWRKTAGVFSTSIEHGLGPAAAALFFCDYLMGQGPKAYLQEKGIARIQPFLPQVVDQTVSCPSFFVALAFLTLAEVSPSSQFVEPALVAGETWINAFPDHTVFWSDQGVGRRLCRTLEAALYNGPVAPSLDAEQAARLDTLLSRLVALGVKDAFILEQRLHS